MNKIKFILLAPLLYGRYFSITTTSFLVFLLYRSPQVDSVPTPELLQAGFFALFISYIFYAFVMGNCGLMTLTTGALIKFFKIEYNSYREDSYLALHSVYSKYKITVSDKEFYETVAEMGGNAYNWKASLERRIIKKFLLS